MAFLDNSGDIILDAVLTDTGRMRLARGDGSFRITKFALGDDEINYSLYDKNNASGSAYFDLSILQTPVFEAFTNNIASLNSRLISISRNDLLYLPVLKINSTSSPFAISQIVQNGYIFGVDADTETYLLSDALRYNGILLSSVGGVRGIIRGVGTNAGGYIEIHQGIDNANVPATNTIPQDLKETQYLVEIDNRFADIIVSTTNANPPAATPSFIDDDSIATYYFSFGVDTNYVNDLGTSVNTSSPIIGARGTKLQFKLATKLEVQTSDYLFNQLGTDVTARFSGVAATNVRSIVTSVRITGLTTGYSVDVPLVLIKKIA